jgi:hypothetical protein
LTAFRFLERKLGKELQHAAAAVQHMGRVQVCSIFRHRAQWSRSHQTQCEFEVLFDSFAFKQKN